jgi:hypothetical protein
MAEVAYYLLMGGGLLLCMALGVDLLIRLLTGWQA